MNIQNIETLLTNAIAFGVTEHGLDACVKARDALAEELGVSHEQRVVNSFTEAMTDLLNTAKLEGFNKLETLYAIQDLLNYRIGFFKYMGFTVPVQFSVQPVTEAETVEASEPNQSQSKPEPKEVPMSIKNFVKNAIEGAEFITEIQAANINATKPTKDFTRAYMAIRALDGIVHGNALEKLLGAAQLAHLAAYPHVSKSHLAVNVALPCLSLLRNGFREEVKVTAAFSGIASAYSFLRNAFPQPVALPGVNNDATSTHLH